MNGLNSLDTPTINGLRHLTLDNLEASSVNATTIMLDNVESTNVVIDNDLILNNGAVILANGMVISDAEISYLDGLSDNIQGQINDIVTDVNDVEIKTQNISATSGNTTITGNLTLSNVNVNGINISDVEISYLNDLSDNIQLQIDNIVIDNGDVVAKTQNQSGISGETTFSGDVIFDRVFFTSNPGQYQDVAFTQSEKDKLSWLNSTEEGLLVNQITFIEEGDPVPIITSQITAFTNTYKDRVALLDLTSQRLKINKIEFSNSTEQTTAFTTTYQNRVDILDITSQRLKINKIEFSDGTELTTVPTYNITDQLIDNNQLLNLPSTLSTSSWYGPSAYVWKSLTYFDWLNPSFFDTSTNTLKVGNYQVSVMFTFGSLNQIQRIQTTMGVYLDSTRGQKDLLEQGIYYDSAVSTQPYVFYSSPAFTFQITEPDVAYITLSSVYHFKANSGCKFRGQIFLQRTT